MRNNKLLFDNIVEGILQKKGHSIIGLDLRKIHNMICDYFIICHGDSGTQVNAIADSIEEQVKNNLNRKAGHREGMENAMWILLDYHDIVVHVFQQEYRDYYRLEELWGDARTIRIEESFK